MNRLNQLGHLKLREIEIFYLAAKTKSIREVARRLSSTPGQISKTVKSIEKKMQTPLFKRSNMGIVLTETGSQLILFSENILDSAYQMESSHRRDAKKTLAVASTPFLINHLISYAAAHAFENNPKFSLRLMDITPDQIINLGLRGAFEVAFHFNKLDWPQTWHQQKIGVVEWVLCARVAHPLKKTATRNEVLQYPFIQPTYWTVEGLVKGNDFFDIPISKRIQGYETSTADAAIPLLFKTNQLACLPMTLIRPQLEKKTLKIIRVPEIKSAVRDLYISAKADSLTSILFETLKSQVEILLNT